MTLSRPVAVAPATRAEAPALAGREAASEGAAPRLLHGAGTLYQWLEVALDRAVSAPLNPLYHTGTIALFSLAVATATGVYLLFFYRVGVGAAYGSVEGIVAQPLGIGAVMRSLHRYASDAALFAALLHGLKMLLGDRFRGARWVGWVTGLVLVALVWVTGATGYWLVWDVQAQVLSLATARLLDALPLFPEPLVRTFLRGDRIQNFLFFIVLFLHITVPLLLALLYWLHVMRLARPRMLPPRVVLWVTGVALVAASLIRPALSGPPADLARLPGEVPLDAFYFSYLPFTHLDPRAGWAIVAGTGLVALALPWLLKGPRPPVARVAAPLCTGCTRCYRDCPYEAIAMVPRRSPGPGKVEAVVIADKCVGCGICVGACDTDGILLAPREPGLSGHAPPPRPLLAGRGAGGARVVVYACRLAPRLAGRVGPSGALPALPGTALVPVPCAGFLHPDTIREALDAGARGVYVAGCQPEDCYYREGATWLAQRLTGERLPKLEGVPEGRVRVGWYAAVEVGRLLRDVAAFAEGRAHGPAVPDRRPRGVRVAGFAALLVGVAWGLGAFAAWPWRAGASEATLLRVAVRHVAPVLHPAERRSAEDLARLPLHMRPQGAATAARGPRAATRLRVTADGREVLARTYRPTGLRHDGPSYAYEEVRLPPGRYRLEVALAGEGAGEDVVHRLAREVTIGPGDSPLLEFSDAAGWTYTAPAAAVR